MNLSKYFEINDGSITEVDIKFSDSSQVAAAFKTLYELGAHHLISRGECFWIRSFEEKRPFAGPEDATLVASGIAEPFHVLLSGISGNDCQIPDLGVFESVDSLDFDYRMGADWGPREIDSLLAVLLTLHALGGQVGVPWGGADGQRDFVAALSGTQNSCQGTG